MDHEDVGWGIYSRVMKPMWNTFNIDIEPPEFLERWQRYREEQRHLYAVHLCQCEICNGGFHQFFWNQSGILAPEAVAGFRAVGMPRCAAMVQQAMGFFGIPYPRRWEDRHELLNRIPGETREERDPFHKLDEPFYALLDSEAHGVVHGCDKYAMQFVTPDETS